MGFGSGSMSLSNSVAERNMSLSSVGIWTLCFGSLPLVRASSSVSSVMSDSSIDLFWFFGDVEAMSWCCAVVGAAGADAAAVFLAGVSGEVSTVIAAVAAVAVLVDVVFVTVLSTGGGAAL